MNHNTTINNTTQPIKNQRLNKRDEHSEKYLKNYIILISIFSRNSTQTNISTLKIKIELYERTLHQNYTKSNHDGERAYKAIKRRKAARKKSKLQNKTQAKAISTLACKKKNYWGNTRKWRSQNLRTPEREKLTDTKSK